MRFAGMMVFFTLLISLQTAVFSSVVNAFPLYDLLLPAVVYATLFRPYASELSAIVLAGLVMDLLSEAPPGFYLISYSAVLLIFQKTKKYFHVRNMGLFQVVCLVGILIEYFVFIISSMIQTLSVEAPLQTLSTVIVQAGWAIVTVPFFYIILNYGYKHFDQFLARSIRPTV